MANLSSVTAPHQDEDIKILWSDIGGSWRRQKQEQSKLTIRLIGVNAWNGVGKFKGLMWCYMHCSFGGWNGGQGM